MKIYDSTDCGKLLARPFEAHEKELATVREILANVRERGNAAVFGYEKKFDSTDLTEETFRVSEEEFEEAYRAVSPELLSSLKKAIANVLSYHKREGRKDRIEKSGGRTTGYVVRPVGSAGIYVPGGTAPLSSSGLMGVLPAKGGKIHPLTLVAAKECGADEVYKTGGAQAIAALAYGTQTLKKVDVIAGPGKIYVTLAKKEVYGQVGIDMLAGPSEILILADGSAQADRVAADMLSQAEHDVLARAIVITDDKKLAEEVVSRVEARLSELPRREIAEKSLNAGGGIILVKDMEEGCALANEIAPEHLELYTENPEELLPLIRTAGAVFMGGFTPEPVGDYFAGPDHILPTGGSAKFFSVLNEDAFTRKMSVIRYDEAALNEDGADIVRLARSESLEAHARAVLSRTEEK